MRFLQFRFQKAQRFLRFQGLQQFRFPKALWFWCSSDSSLELHRTAMRFFWFQRFQCEYLPMLISLFLQVIIVQVRLVRHDRHSFVPPLVMKSLVVLVTRLPFELINGTTHLFTTFLLLLVVSDYRLFCSTLSLKICVAFNCDKLGRIIHASLFLTAAEGSSCPCFSNKDNTSSDVRYWLYCSKEKQKFRSYLKLS